MGNETPSTAFTTPSSVKKWVFRFLMSIRTSGVVLMKRASLSRLPGSLQSRVHGVAQAVADDVEDRHRDEDRDARKDGEPPLFIVLHRQVQDGAPAGGGGPRSEAENAQGRFGHDRARDAERR